MDEENIVRRMINGDMGGRADLRERGGQRGHCPGDIHRLLFKQKEAPGSGSL